MRTDTEDRVARRRPAFLRRYEWDAYLYLVPAVAFYAVFLLRPTLETVWIALFEWDGISASTWVGGQNFADVLGDPLVWEALAHALVFIVFYAVIPIVIALVVVAIVSRFRVHGLAAFRTIFFLPYILSTVVVAIAWRWLFAADGPVNGMLHAIGLGTVARSWLGDFSTALPAVGVIGSWIMFGLAFVLFVSGLQNVPREQYEAARIDGAGAVREFFVVTLPGLRGEIQVALVLLVTAALRNFDIVWNTTSGGPGTATTVPSYFIYREAFMTHHVGRASAIAVALTVIIFALVGMIMWLTRDKERRTR